MSKVSNNKIAEPLSDEDVQILMRKISKIDPKVLNPIFSNFSNVLNSIVAIALEQAKNDEDSDDILALEQARRIINICPAEEKFLRIKDKIWNVRNHIINKDAKFFLDRDYSGMIKKDSNKAFIESLMEIVKGNFSDIPKEAQNMYWKKAQKMLRIVCEFKKAVKAVKTV